MKVWEEAMRKGYIESCLMILVLVGVTGSGKTRYKNLVLGLPVPECCVSTALAETPIRSMSICQVAVGGGNIEWRVVAPGEMLDMVADSIKSGVPILDLNWEEISQLAFSECTDFDEMLAELLQSNTEDKECCTLPETAPVLDPGTGDGEEVSQSVKNTSKPVLEDSQTLECSSADFSEEFLTAVNAIDIDQKLLKRISKSSGCKKLMNIDWVYVVDSGGQPQFREMLPHFVHDSSAFVLLQKLNESLGFKPSIEYRGEGSRMCGTPYQSQLTNEEILYQYFQAIQSHGSRVFMVGTHRDLKHECSESVEMKNQRLLEAFRPVLGKSLAIFHAGNPDQFMFPVNCKTPEPCDKETAQKFRETVMKLCSGKKVKIPLPWFVLEQLLRQLAEKMQMKVLSIEECHEVAQKKLQMPRNVCQAAIEYLGKLNIFFYRPSILPRVVMCDSQVVLDKITELVRCSHELKGTTSGSQAQDRQGSEWLDFRDYGKISSKFLKEFPSHYREGLFTTQEFLQLLEGMLIAAKLRNGEHFMPSVLPDLALEKVASYRVTALRHPAPMAIHYPKKWLPVGAVPSLVAYLQNHYKWAPVASGGKPKCLYHNCMKFELPGGKAGSVVLIDSIKFLEIHVKASLKVASEVCPQIRDMILLGLKEAHKSLHYDSATPEEGFLCSGECGNTEVHLATLDEKRESWRCTEDEEEGEELSQRQTIWFGTPGHRGKGEHYKT